MKSVALGKTTHTFMAKWFPSQHVHHTFNLSVTPQWGASVPMTAVSSFIRIQKLLEWNEKPQKVPFIFPLNLVWGAKILFRKEIIGSCAISASVDSTLPNLIVVKCLYWVSRLVQSQWKSIKMYIQNIFIQFTQRWFTNYAQDKSLCIFCILPV